MANPGFLILCFASAPPAPKPCSRRYRWRHQRHLHPDFALKDTNGGSYEAVLNLLYHQGLLQSRFYKAREVLKVRMRETASRKSKSIAETQSCWASGNRIGETQSGQPGGKKHPYVRSFQEITRFPVHENTWIFFTAPEMLTKIWRKKHRTMDVDG